MVITEPELNLFEAILARRSVRSYAPKPVEKPVLNTLLEAAVWAPTAMHKQPWAFVIINNQLILRQLSTISKHLLQQMHQRNRASPLNPHLLGDNIFYDASTLIIICGKTNHDSPVADCWMAAENLMLAACGMQLGSCVIDCALLALNLPEIREQLKIPENYEPIAPIIIGYPLHKPQPVTRRAPIILNTIN